MPAPPASARLRRITSRQNALLKDLRKAFSASGHEEGLCAIEGVRLIEEAIRSGIKLRAVLFSDMGAVRAERLLAQIGAKTETAVVDDEIFRTVVSTETPQGVAALLQLKPISLNEMAKADDPLLVVAAGLQDPGNLGTLVRSAEAFGSAGIVVTEKTVSVLNPKTLRAAAGSAFRLPWAEANSQELVPMLRETGFRLYGTSSHRGTSLPEAKLGGKVAIFIGNEGAGLPAPVEKQMDDLLVVPHSKQVESLNAGIAASLILYEAARQRAEK